MECILKLVGMGNQYFVDGWNRFDFLIVLGTWVGIITTLSTDIEVGATVTIVRAFRICRIFRLVKKAKSLRMIFNSLVLTIPSLANVGALLLLMWYIFAILGLFLFAKTKLQDNLNTHANFQSFGIAFLTLIRMSTGESWNFIMHDCLRKKTPHFHCIHDPTYAEIQENGGNFKIIEFIE
jgi:hypothetical protein